MDISEITRILLQQERQNFHTGWMPHRFGEGGQLFDIFRFIIHVRIIRSQKYEQYFIYQTFFRSFSYQLQMNYGAEFYNNFTVEFCHLH